MNVVRGLYFPGTLANPELFRSLLCLLDKVDFYQLVEPAAPPADDLEGAASWQGQVVLPLGRDRERFLAMIRDIKIHAADYYGGYLAALSADSLVDRDEAAVWQLVASLHDRNKKSAPDPVLTEKLWQARLVLKLAEILAEEQAELAAALAKFDRKEQAVFEALRGELDDREELDGPEELGPFFQQGLELTVGQEGARMRPLLKAWGTLFVMDSRPPSVLVTDSEDAAAIFFEAWAELAGERPRRLVALELPVVETLAAVTATRAELAAAGTSIRQALREILAGDPLAGTANLRKAATLWQSQIAGQEGRKCRATIYHLPGHSLRAVWGRLSRMPVSHAAADHRQHGLVAVLKPAP